MPGFLTQLQRSVGRALHAVHRIGGWRADYTLISDHAQNPKTTITFSNIYMKPTAVVRLKETLGGRIREVPGQGGLFSLEQQPYFEVSREALRATSGMTDSAGAAITEGTYYTPSIDDEFVEDGTATPIFRVIQVIEMAAVTPGWLLAYQSIFRHRSGG